MRTSRKASGHKALRAVGLGLGLGLGAALVGVPGAAQADFTLTLLHTNDFHSRIEPINKYDSGCSAKDDEAGKCFGGSARLAKAVAMRRAALDAEGSASLLLDGGDQFQGSLFYTTYKGKAAAELMNAIGYDAMTVGNHEFDDGPDVLRGFIRAVDFPILMSNADVSKEPALARVLKPYTVVEKNGEKIGIIGATTPDTPELSSPGKNITFIKPESALRYTVAELEADGVDKIILLSHLGFWADQRVATVVPGIDVIVGGHTNTFLSNTSNRADGPYPYMVGGPDGTMVPIVQAYAYGRYLGELEIVFDDAGKVVSATGEPLSLDASIDEDAAIVKRIEELAKPLDKIREQRVGETTEPIDGSRDTCRAQECQMGSLVADAMLDRVKGQGVQIAIQNGGGLRASIDAGEITMGEVLTVLPFQNTLATFWLYGSDIEAALENGFSQVEEGGGRFPQIAGMKVVWNPTKPAGERVVSVEVAQADGSYAPLSPDTRYGVVTNNFMRRGGDGYSVFEKKGEDAYDYGPNLEQVVMEYLQKEQSFTPYTDGRIASE